MLGAVLPLPNVMSGDRPLWGLGFTLTWPWVWEVAWLVLQRVPAAQQLFLALKG